MSGNSALRPQIGVTGRNAPSVDYIIDTHDTDLTVTGVSQIYTVSGKWEDFVSGSESALAASCFGAGYILGKFEFVPGTQLSVRIPLFDTSDPA